MKNMLPAPRKAARRDGRVSWRAIAAVALLAPLGACASLPASGPTANQVVKGEREQANALGFTLIDVTADTIPESERAALVSTAPIEALARPGRVDLLGPGDVLQVSIFEVGVSLFGGAASIGEASEATTFDPTARSQQMQGVIVGDDGYISLPYIGRIRAAGRTTEQVRQQVVRGLAGKSQAPQALVSVVENVTNTVLIGGLVAEPGRQRLSLGRERLLDAIAGAGGLKDPASWQNAVVRFTRDGKTAEAYYNKIAPGSAADLQLLPGDRIDIIHMERSFTVFGAAGAVSEVPFRTENVSLSDAVARAGGPSEQSADPTGVFIFRFVPDATAPNGERPVIYRIDLMKPSSYFLSQRFMMRDKDVLYVANARFNQTRKMVEVMNMLFSPILQARAVARR
ncbi:polysaccharide biosynthesis/export family protein [Sphingobium sp. AN641]|uniref:polysaccharide biosynthesis/export family protein n=1 Tax=Sphingobium sp. AN641 TaxID=3133443 RepID=UPI0030C2DFF8